MNTDDNMYEGYIKTISGRKFYLGVDDVESIHINDIAHALANVNRFAGHTARPYSVAEHCLLVLNLLRSWGCTNNKTLMTGLLHDATEAYLPDMPTPFKAHMPQFKELEDHLWQRIAWKFDLWEKPEDVPEVGISEVIMGTVTAELLSRSLIKHADRTALFVEASVLQPNGDSENWPEYEFYGMLARDWLTKVPPNTLHQRLRGDSVPRDAFIEQHYALSVARDLSGE